MSDHISLNTESSDNDRFETVSFPTANFSVKRAVDYKFSEDKYLKELQVYIDSTYGQHYANRGKIQTTSYILDQCSTPDFLRGNILKYAARYGNKDGYVRKDILKAIHYCILMLHYHDTRQEKN